MIFEDFPSLNMNLRDKLFSIDNKIYFAYSKVGVQIQNGIRSPIDCGSFGKTKIESFLKSLSESLERRSLVSKRNDYIEAIDLISEKNILLEAEKIFFSKNATTDTTGCAADIEPERAVKSAILELIEKNATLLFWYNQEGYILRGKFIEKIKKEYSLNYNYTADFFLNQSFYPLCVVYCLLKDENGNMIFGTGCEKNIGNAAKKAIKEALFLLNVENDISFRSEKLNLKPDKYTSAKISSLNNEETKLKLASYPLITFPDSVFFTNETISLEEIIVIMRDYVENLNIAFLPAYSRDYVVCRAYSNELINYVPFKFNLTLNKKIFNRIHEKNIFNIEKTPELPIM